MAGSFLHDRARRSTTPAIRMIAACQARKSAAAGGSSAGGAVNDALQVSRERITRPAADEITNMTPSANMASNSF
jgi:hypothetical protein